MRAAAPAARPSIIPPAAVGMAAALPEPEADEPVDWAASVVVPVTLPLESVSEETWELAAEATCEVMVLPSEVSVVRAPAPSDEMVDTMAEPPDEMVVTTPPTALVAVDAAPLASEVRLDSTDVASDRMLDRAAVAVLPAPVTSEMTLGRTPAPVVVSWAAARAARGRRAAALNIILAVFVDFLLLKWFKTD